jgi:hypothetical protein
MKRILLSLTCLITFSNAAFCQDVNDINSPAKGWDSFIASAEKDLPTLPGEMLRQSTDIYFRTENLAALLMAGGASVIMHNEPADESIDDKIADNFEEHNQLREFEDRALDFIGGPGFHFGAAGLWYGLAAASQDDLNRNRAWTMLTALSVTGATTVVLKAAVDNRTPNDKPWAWPSGHTASSFTVASVLDEFYGPWVGIPAYGMAGLVGYRMMETGDHWASDVLFGGVLGWIVGHGVAGNHKELKVGGFEVMPYFGESGATGIALVRQF